MRVLDRLKPYATRRCLHDDRPSLAQPGSLDGSESLRGSLGGRTGPGQQSTAQLRLRLVAPGPGQ